MCCVDIPEANTAADFPHPAVFHIASSLAASVLQFHSTPWLPETWRSQDITFFTVDKISAKKLPQLSNPYFKIEFAKRTQQSSLNSKGKGKAIESHPTTTTTTTTIINTPSHHCTNTHLTGAPNDLLFRLGILLVEIGYSGSWQALRDAELEESALPPSRQTDYHIAERLCKEQELLRKMGPKYVLIVKKCIECHFLSESELVCIFVRGPA